MFKRTINIALAPVVALTGMAAAPAFSQQSATLEEILVTARRVRESLQEVPISMTVYDQDALDKRNITIASELATYTPSLSVNERYGPEKSAFSIRGFNQDQSTAPTVGVYFADVVGVRAQGGTTSGNTVGAGAFMDLENVQILKGPQGTLFGRNTNGGAILLVPTKPHDTFGGYGEVSVGNYDMRRFQGALNVPVSDTFRMRFALDDNDREGYMENQAGPDDFNDRNYTAFRASAVWDITPTLENYTIFHHSKSETNGYAGRIVGCDRTAVPDAFNRIDLLGMLKLEGCNQLDRQAARGDGPLDVESNIDDPFLDIEQWQIINTTTWEVNDNLTVKNIFSYGEFEEKTHFDLYTTNYSIPDSVNFLNFGPQAPFIPVVPGTPHDLIELDLLPGEANSQQKTWTEELQLQGVAFDERLQFVIGGYLEFSDPIGQNAGRTSIFADCGRPQNLGDCNFNAVPLAGSISQSTTEFEFENHGVFAQGTWDFNEQWALTAGLRYTFDSIEGYDESVRISPPPFQSAPLISTCRDVFRFPGATGQGLVVSDPSECGKILEQDSEEPTWLINLDYKPNADILLFAKYARGYRQGGINFTNPGVETWEPEQVDNYEVGAKISFSGDIPGYFNIAAFYNDYTDQQVFGALVVDRQEFPNVSGGAAIFNAGESEIAGIEIDATALFFDSLQVSASYAYLDTEIKELDTSSISLEGTPFAQVIPRANEGQTLNLAPEHKLTVTASYMVPIPAEMGEMSIGATYTYTDEQLADATQPPPTDVLPSRDLVNLNFDWQRVAGSAFDLAIFATNVTDEEYPVATGGGFASFGIADFLYGEPRMYGARLRYNFGDQ